MTKNQIRIDYLARRERFSPELAASAAAAINERLCQIVSGNATTVAGYCSIRSEVDVLGAMQDFDRQGLRLCLPVIEAADKPLYFRRWKLDEALEKGRYGILVPPAQALSAKPDVMLVPMVAFDRVGHRLGYGAGYYDRTIRHYRADKSLLVIGVAYAMQEVEQIPADGFDERLDMIVTDKEIIRFTS